MKTIFNIPFAAGNKFSYNKIFLNHRNYITYEYQRDNNVILEIDKISDYLLKILKENNFHNGIYYIYGHSMGALLGYLVCHKLLEENLPMPQKLIVTGKKAPAVPGDKIISHLPDNEFWNEILTLGGIPDEMKNYPELIEYYLPILRHDFRLIESYQYEKKPKLNIPIDVFYGFEEATEDEMLGWEDETTEKVTITQLSGNHFFIFDHVEYFRNYFDNLVNQK